MNAEHDYITKEKKQELEHELAELRGPKRKEILEALEFAKSLGDLSENAEYHQAREEQGKLEDRISKVEYILKESIIVDKHHSNRVEVGATLSVQKEGSKEKKTYQIVGSEEANMAESKISNHSPLGMALLGKQKGDTVEFKSPSGMVKYTILAIE
ncbi:MAG: transcription elongation factor GreA [Candidatus Paceibacterota bacterium]|jgi:transcription elongation factor GreA